MKTKLDIISGFLGSGKTTLIKKIICEKKDSEKIVVIENDFGEISIDSDILKSSNVNVTEISAGCVCCSLRGKLLPSILEIIESFHPHRIIIEPTGLAKLSELKQLFREPDYSHLIELNILAVVVDVKRYDRLFDNLGDFFINQIVHAKSIFLSKTQFVSDKAIEKVVASIKKVNKHANVITTEWDRISSEAIINIAEQSKDTSLKQQIKKAMKLVESKKLSNTELDEIFSTFEIETPVKYTKESIYKFLEELKKEDLYGTVLRGKGILQESSGKWFHFEFVPEEINIEDFNADYSGRVCFIGESLNLQKFQDFFK